ncbi:MAG: chromate transporter [Butyricicoccus sp.]|nr:chromate transporter [Butyricicoccus sp.]
MICVQLFLNFARIAICTLGGGAATIPFLMELPGKYGWVTEEQLAGIIAIGESAPGPGGVNMASCIGYQAAGIPGVLCAVAGLCLPSIIIVTLVAICVHGFQDRPVVKQFFYGLRPAVVAAIAVAVLGLMGLMLVREHQIYWRAIGIYAVGFAVTHLPACKRIPLLVWIVAAGVAGMVFSC